MQINDLPSVFHNDLPFFEIHFILVCWKRREIYRKVFYRQVF